MSSSEDFLNDDFNLPDEESLISDNSGNKSKEDSDDNGSSLVDNSEIDSSVNGALDSTVEESSSDFLENSSVDEEDLESLISDSDDFDLPSQEFLENVGSGFLVEEDDGFELPGLSELEGEVISNSSSEPEKSVSSEFDDFDLPSIEELVENSPKSSDEYLSQEVAPVFSDSVDSGSLDEVLDDEDLTSLSGSSGEEIEPEAEVSSSMSDSFDSGVSLDDILSGSDSEDREDDDEEEDEESDTFGSLFGSDDSEDEDDDYDDEDELGGFDVDELLAEAIDVNASDVQISANDYPWVSVLGEWRRIYKFGIITSEIANALREQNVVVSHVSEGDFAENLELDTSYILKNGRHQGRRTRLSMIRQNPNEMGFTFRIISDVFPKPEDLGITSTITKWTENAEGLVMFNGATGSGKALRLDTIIPSPDGDLIMGELKVGDKVFSSKGEICNVIGLSEINEDPELYKFKFSDGQVVFADKHHQWVVYTDKSFDSVEILSYALGLHQVGALYAGVSLSLIGAYQILEDYGFIGKVFEDFTEVKNVLEFSDFENIDGFFMGDEFFNVLARRLRGRLSSGSFDACLTTSELVAGYRWNRMTVPTLDKGSLRIESLERVSEYSYEYSSVRCISVDSPDKTYLCADRIVTHNTTSIASIIRDVQMNQKKKIITIEKPVEFDYGNDGSSVVVQREVGKDTRSFSNGLDSAMRQAPDMILVGEVRNREEIEQLLRAAETGHLTISTMHTNSAPQTINRIISNFEGSEQKRILSTLAEISRGFVNQVLVKSIDGKSRFAVREILEVNDRVSELIEQGDVKGIRKYLVETHNTIEHGLVKAVIDGRCLRAEARSHTSNKTFFDELLDGKN